MKTSKQVSEIKVADLMTKRVETLMPSDSIKDAVNMMLDCKVSTVPIVDGQNKCVGILSRSDLTEMFVQEDNELAHVLDTDRLSIEWLNRSLDTGEARKVSELMVYDVATIRSSQSLVQACQEMAQHQIHHLPVVDDKDSIVGIISTFDVVVAVAGN